MVISLIARRIEKLERTMDVLQNNIIMLKDENKTMVAQNKTTDAKLSELLLRSAIIKVGEASNRMTSVCEREKVRQLAKKSPGSIDHTSDDVPSEKITSFEFSLPLRVGKVCQRFKLFRNQFCHEDICKEVDGKLVLDYKVVEEAVEDAPNLVNKLEDMDPKNELLELSAEDVGKLKSIQSDF